MSDGDTKRTRKVSSLLLSLLLASGLYGAITGTFAITSSHRRPGLLAAFWAGASSSTSIFFIAAFFMTSEKQIHALRLFLWVLYFLQLILGVYVFSGGLDTTEVLRHPNAVGSIAILFTLYFLDYLFRLASTAEDEKKPTVVPNFPTWPGIFFNVRTVQPDGLLPSTSMEAVSMQKRNGCNSGNLGQLLRHAKQKVLGQAIPQRLQGNNPSAEEEEKELLLAEESI